MHAEQFQAALYSPQGTHATDAVWTRPEYEALHGRARAALRALWLYRAVNNVSTLGPRDYALMRSVRRCGDAQEICSAVRECMTASDERRTAGPHL